MGVNKRVKTNSTDAGDRSRRFTEIGIHGAFLTIFGLMILLSLISFDARDLALHLGDDEIANWMGAFGVRLAWILFETLGVLSYVIAPAVVYIGVMAVVRKPFRFSPLRVISPFTALLCLSILLHMAFQTRHIFDSIPDGGFDVGGAVGTGAGELLSVLIQDTGTVIIALIGLALSVMYIAGVTLRQVFRTTGGAVKKAATTAVDKAKESARNSARARQDRRKAAHLRSGGEDDDDVSTITPAEITPLPDTKNERNGKGQVIPDDEPTRRDPIPVIDIDRIPADPGDVDQELNPPVCPPDDPCDDEPAVRNGAMQSKSRKVDDQDGTAGDDEERDDPDMPGIRTSGPRIVLNKRSKANVHEDQMIPGVVRGPWEPPSLSLLDYVDPGQQEVDQAWLRQNAERLENKLLDYKVQGKVTEIHPGPVVTMYEFLPAAGVKISQIANLADDLTMALEAVSIRIVAPIPGRGVVGIEVPNKVRETVYLREILASDEFTKSKSKLTIALGKDIFGSPVVTDLGRMPHLLIAGATGSGKSVAVNAFILSLLRNASPEEVRIILVDPKVVELQVYEDIPHLLLPVVYDPKHAAAALRWAVDEMERRYSLLARVSARNIATFNQRVEKLARVKSGAAGLDPDDEFDSGFAPNPDDFDDEDLVKLPFIVIVLDEFADLMMVASKDVETAVARLAQKARAAGIHLIMATQRPSKEVITGLIKANFPSRMAFRVSSSIDSRIILDQRGAEALLGYGDMLFLKPGTSSLERVHGSFVSDDEVGRFVNHLKTQGTPDYKMEIIQSADDDEEIDESDNDPLTEEAMGIIVESGRASISYLQRQLKIGYNRAARIMEILERRRIVGPPDSRGERKILA